MIKDLNFGMAVSYLEGFLGDIDIPKGRHKILQHIKEYPDDESLALAWKVYQKGLGIKSKKVTASRAVFYWYAVNTETGEKFCGDSIENLAKQINATVSAVSYSFHHNRILHGKYEISRKERKNDGIRKYLWIADNQKTGKHFEVQSCSELAELLGVSQATISAMRRKKEPDKKGYVVTRIKKAQ